MAKADHIKKLVASFGRNQEFRAAALRIIDEATSQGKKPFAESLRKILDANVRADYQTAPQPGLTTLASQIDAAADLVDEIPVSRGLNDIVLNSDTRSLIEGLIEERRRREELRRHRLPVSTRLLFSGPAGCGKTLCAEVLARELSLPLYSARIDVIISSLLGETASNLRRLFEFAERRPCILFLDEFDALARTRTDIAEHNELRRVVNSLLLMIERFKGPGLVIAATNLPQSLDEALWRRFDDILSFDPPTEREIALLLKRQFANFPAQFDLDMPVSKLVGMSYADIERICIDAIKKAVLKKRKSISETEFAAALRQETRRKGLTSRRGL
ncbi:ATPase family associated with various cellular activities (AAA) [Bradyrhizobium yuanmingense]|uniref:ATPase family associated with various cellular activities (AAA) n=1 Tax=Bradyrhizobium yuanmingense TaxID=108015 RepID=A0A1C3VKE5_9BRAD|nr:ATP-binding protein [Bradyrhizobium yuanmingense]TWI28553.1 ATPase family protein associated with various cellular activities (AAA) [Bradyrhizobium yuanmingense]SCB28310.1 ATPase family associated with various cellular activities (AAA) [Bradyrhizobium yuanmingense]